jgi:hypothetical protein
MSGGMNDMIKPDRLISWLAFACTVGALGIAIFVGNPWGTAIMLACAGGIGYQLWQHRNRDIAG